MGPGIQAQHRRYARSAKPSDYSRTPQVLKIDYSSGTPLVTIVKSTLKNTLIHLTDMDVNPYAKKYKKYKSKYALLKKIMDNIMNAV